MASGDQLRKPIYHPEREADLIPYEDMGLPTREVTLARLLQRHPDYCRGLTVENDLAVMLHALGEVEAAEAMARRSLASWAGSPLERPNHPIVSIPPLATHD